MERVLDYSLSEHSPYSAEMPVDVRGYIPCRLRLFLLPWYQSLQEQARVEKLGRAAASDVPPPRPVFDKAAGFTTEVSGWHLCSAVMSWLLMAKYPLVKGEYIQNKVKVIEKAFTKCQAKFPTPIPNDGSHPINVALWDSANTMHMWKEVSDEIESHLKALMAKIQKASKAAALRAAKRKR